MWIYLWPQNVLVSSVVQWFEELEPPRIHNCEANIILHNSIITCLHKDKLKCLAVFCARRFGLNSWRSMYIAWPSSLKKSWIIMDRAYRSWLFFITLSVQVASNLDVCFGKYIFIWLYEVSDVRVPKSMEIFFYTGHALFHNVLLRYFTSNMVQRFLRGLYICLHWIVCLNPIYTIFCQTLLLFCKVLRHFVMVLDHSYFDIQFQWDSTI